MDMKQSDALKVLVLEVLAALSLLLEVVPLGMVAATGGGDYKEEGTGVINQEEEEEEEEEVRICCLMGSWSRLGGCTGGTLVQRR
jgi:hypothetical protein